MIKPLLPLALLLASIALPSLADDAEPPDKSGYDLFHPVPDDLLRTFATDRPSKGFAPTTVDAGHFQYESDIVSWTYDHDNSGHVTTSNLLVLDPTFKVGLTNSTDFEVALAPVAINSQFDQRTGSGSTFFGFGDIYARLKYNLFGNDSGDYSLAVVPYVKAPTASRTIGNAHWEGGGYMPFGIALPDDWSVNFLTEIDILEDANQSGTHANYQNLVNISHPVVGDLSGTLEFWSDVRSEAGAGDQYTLDVAAAWALTPTFQLDGGVNFGLDRAAPDFQPYLGVSQRF